MLVAFYPYKLEATRFYSFETRVWELLCGVLLAQTSQRWTIVKSKSFQWIAGAAGFTILLSLQFVWPRVPSFLPVVSTVFLIAGMTQGGVVQRLLSTPILVGVGLISYSLYLWHQPVLALARLYWKDADLTPMQLIWLVALTFALAGATFLLIERPLRNRDWKYARGVVPLSLAMAAGLAVLAFASVETHGFREQYLAFLPPDIASRTAALDRAIESRGLPGMTDRGQCRFWTEQIDDVTKARFDSCSEKFGKALVVLGDSHAMDLFNAMTAGGDQPFIFGLSRGACGPARYADAKCPYYSFQSFVHDNQSHIARVFFTLSGNYFVSNGSLNLSLASATTDYLSALQPDVPVLWLGPQYEPHIALEQLDPARGFDAQIQTVGVAPYIQRDHALAAFASGKNVPYLSKIDGVLLDAKGDFFANGEFSYSDTDHWSAAGEKLFGTRLVKRLQTLSKIP